MLSSLHVHQLIGILRHVFLSRCWKLDRRSVAPAKRSSQEPEIQAVGLEAPGWISSSSSMDKRQSQSLAGPIRLDRKALDSFLVSTRRSRGRGGGGIAQDIDAKSRAKPTRTVAPGRRHHSNKMGAIPGWRRLHRPGVRGRTCWLGRATLGVKMSAMGRFGLWTAVCLSCYHRRLVHD